MRMTVTELWIYDFWAETFPLGQNFLEGSNPFFFHNFAGIESSRMSQMKMIFERAKSKRNQMTESPFSSLSLNQSFSP